MNPKQSFIDKIVQGAKNAFGPAHYVAPTQPAIPIDRVAQSIAHNETGVIQDNPYAFKQPSGNKKIGNALGKYQVTEGELKSYAPRYIGQPISSKEFLASTTAQDNYIKGKIKYYTDQGYTPQQVADIHRRGFSKSSAPGSNTYQDPDYVQKFNNTFLQQ